MIRRRVGGERIDEESFAAGKGAVRHDVDGAADRARILVRGEGLEHLRLARRLAWDQCQIDATLPGAPIGDRNHADAVQRDIVEIRRNAAHRDILALLLAVEHLHRADTGHAGERLG